MAQPPDPRTLVTPDAFSVAPEVLGLPLASPTRRLVALGVDGIAIAMLTSLGWSILGVLAALYFFRLATRGSKEQKGVGRAFQVSMGCLGALILFAVLTTGTQFVSNLFRERARPAALAEGDDPSGANVGFSDLVLGFSEAAAYRSARNPEDALEAATEFAARLASVGTAPDEIEDLLAGMAPEDADWDPEEIAVAAVATLRADDAAADEPPSADVPLTEALAEYRSLLLAGGDSLVGVDRTRARALGATIRGEVARDTLERLSQRIARLQDRVDDNEDALERANADLSAAESRGIFGFLYDLVDELGLTFGWGALYMAVLLSVWQGYTLGKRLLGVQVIRLDGKPMGLFLAFERAGGYAAGVATGLLGFAQILWDPNRQGIHDKIAGTVVVRRGPTTPRVPREGGKQLP